MTGKSQGSRAKSRPHDRADAEDRFGNPDGNKKKGPDSGKTRLLLGGSVLVVGIGIFAFFYFQGDSNGQTRTRDFIRRSTAIMVTLRDTGELTTERRSRLRRAKSLGELETIYKEIRKEQLKGIPIDGPRAFGYLKKMVSFGPRPTGSKAMADQRAWLVQHFTKLGGKVTTDPKDMMRNPQTGEWVEVRNIIVEWHPERKERVLLCAHYDTRPYPDEERDPSRRKGVFVGANDGASGGALLCELAHHMSKIKGPVGVDFVLFDAEELVYDKQLDKYFVGSENFATRYKMQPPAHKYRTGVLLDMIADAQLQIYREKNSMLYARKTVDEIWRVAARLKVREFKQRGAGYEIRDDHLPLNKIAGIPTVDLIDFDYPHPNSRRQYWHTQEDTVDKCSEVSMARVGWVVLEWLKTLR